ncbi:MAG TPA: 3,4-dihydroxy-2-butanone-4-phosphate synthase [Methanoregulaceae archaeon]|nr:MAG: 3,4-dihydroxy-2-butanone-4-phosphate synthase [Methanolinea sp.]HON81958.1 3,4-dihydroxy-2-butanone-4-phosphate synthase [Methanoregulaceae archaeon]HPD10714.1 3,4-dihydroxy-2-butanone-4-phosphate synthase [Methanoregulaceae archaeon]HRT15843.1 3,4-dihydroxy-2-butanone-4-phosphate synthase [Methanoregulaceae archaeon]HRU31600.1 3,4-dihydroxy-2-butanone-4-phosphate synthase [Methanoregulaceae archaeon]
MIQDALQALREGKFILLYDFDDREGETDFAIRADRVMPADVARMRRDGGGLICTAIPSRAADRLGLPFATDLLRSCPGMEGMAGPVPYDPKNRSSFSLWVNHRDTWTGVTDNDRALTIRAIADQVSMTLNGGGENFHSQFRSPGHVALLRADEKLLDQRRGQTELSIALATMAGITPAITICEMLDEQSGTALSKAGAQAYARSHGLVFIEGSEVVEAWGSPTP